MGENCKEMTEHQQDFSVALRLSGISLTKHETVLAFELAKAVLQSKELDLQGWARTHAKHSQPPKPQPQKSRYYTTLTISPGHCEWPKAC